MNSASEAIALLRRNVGRVYVGHPEAVDLLMVALVVNGHVLVEDVPGTGKTTLLKALARSLGLSFSRIQCTPDLLPADITGLTYFDQRTGEWRFRAGPVLAHVVLVDEINRATPRTQSALLEAMEERQVTVDGETHPCPRPFLVLATQNPVEMDGTFPLPEAQLDRFMLRLHLGYPAAEDEEEMVRRHASSNLLAELEPVLRDTDIVELQKTAARVHVSDPVLHYCRGDRPGDQEPGSSATRGEPESVAGVVSLQPGYGLVARPELCFAGRCEGCGRAGTGSSHYPRCCRPS